MTEDVNIHVHGHAGHLSLNRPKALHALTLDMCHAISAALTDWADDEAVQAIILDHAEGRGFCAGGDINLLRNSALNDGGKSGREFFHDEYQLNHQMFEYEKPIVAFMDGITMGGGVAFTIAPLRHAPPGPAPHADAVITINSDVKHCSGVWPIDQVPPWARGGARPRRYHLPPYLNELFRNVYRRGSAHAPGAQLLSYK